MQGEGNLELVFYILDVDSTPEGHIKLFGVTPNKQRVYCIDKTSLPYFYVIPKEGQAGKVKEKLAALELNIGTDIAKIKSISLDNKNFKVAISNSSHVPIFAASINKFSEVDHCEEYDIKYARRYLMDKKLTPFTPVKVVGKIIAGFADANIEIQKISQISLDVIPNLKLLAFDIETLCSKALPDTNTDSIVFIGFYSQNFQKVITWKRFENAPEHVVFVNGELELLQEFSKTIKQFKPDVLVGYGSDHFDLPYIFARAEKYNLKLELASESQIELSQVGRKTAHIFSLPHLDVSHFVRSILDLDVDRYKLDNVAKVLLGKGKLFNLGGPAKVNEIWSVGLPEDLRSLADYNLIDAQLAYEICFKILPIQLELVKLLGLPVHDVNRMTYGQLVEWYLIRHSSEFNLRIPHRPLRFEILRRLRQTYVGAYVVEPKPGFYKNIFVFDFRSLYPTIIVSHNISPETLRCDCCAWKNAEKVDENSWFCVNKTGFFPGLIKDIIERRKRVQEILKQTPQSDPAYNELQARSHALKYVAVSFYGYLGFAGSRWYSINCASAVTSLGRKYILMVLKEAEKFGFEVLYGDTDSLFLQAKEKSEQNIKQFLQIVNSTLPAPMELEYRDFYSSGLFLEKKGSRGGAKKRYALLTKDEKVILRGVEAIRGDWSELAKKAQKEVFTRILKDGNAETAAKYVQDLISKVKNRKMPIEDFVIKIKLTRPISAYVVQSPHVVAAQQMAAKGQIAGKGDNVRYIITKGSGKLSERVKLAEDATAEDYDETYYIDNQIIRAVYKVFELFGYAEEKLKGGQATLSGW